MIQPKDLLNKDNGLTRAQAEELASKVNSQLAPSDPPAEEDSSETANKRLINKHLEDAQVGDQLTVYGSAGNGVGFITSIDNEKVVFETGEKKKQTTLPLDIDCNTGIRGNPSKDERERQQANIVRNMGSEELGKFIATETLGFLRKSRELKPYFEELWARFRRGESICGCSTREQYCERILHRSIRSVQYHLYGRPESPTAKPSSTPAVRKPATTTPATNIPTTLQPLETQPISVARFRSHLENIAKYGKNLSPDIISELIQIVQLASQIISKYPQPSPDAGMSFESRTAAGAPKSIN